MATSTTPLPLTNAHQRSYGVIQQIFQISSSIRDRMRAHLPLSSQAPIQRLSMDRRMSWISCQMADDRLATRDPFKTTNDHGMTAPLTAAYRRGQLLGVLERVP
jgi:hypothetical protein